jgi:MSHA pilin protein MshA
VKNRIQAGFTLVELIVVIVILGILAAVALGLEREARVAAVKSMGGTLLSAANMAHGVCMARNCANGSTITIDGRAIVFQFGYPNDASMDLLVQSYEGFSINGAGNQFTKLGAATPAACFVQYNQPAAANASPTISYPGGVVIRTQANETTVNNGLRTNC